MKELPRVNRTSDPVEDQTRHVFVKHGCPWRQQSQNMAKNLQVLYLTSPQSQGNGMSVKCEDPIDELTVQVWLLYDHPNFNYWTLFVSGTELQTDGWTNDPITRCPRRTFQAGGLKSQLLSFSEILLEFCSIVVKVYKNVHFTEFHSLS